MECLLSYNALIRQLYRSQNTAVAAHCLGPHLHSEPVFAASPGKRLAPVRNRQVQDLRLRGACASFHEARGGAGGDRVPHLESQTCWWTDERRLRLLAVPVWVEPSCLAECTLGVGIAASACSGNPPVASGLLQRMK